MLDASALRDDRPDVVATFHPDGQLAAVRVALSADDTTAAITLTLNPDKLEGRAEHIHTNVFNPVEPADDEGSYFDDSDVEITPAMRYERWVTDWLDRVYDLRLGIALVCSFCGKSQQEVAKLIAGPSVFICDECITLCNEILAEGNVGAEPGAP